MAVLKLHLSKTAVRGGKSLLLAAREHSVLLLFAFFLLCGMGVGAVCSGSTGAKELDGLDFLFNASLSARTADSAGMVFASSFASSFLFVFACFLCGLSMWGSFIIPAVVFFRGYGLGIASGYLYLSYGFYGFLFNAAVFLPGSFVCCLALLFAAQEGARLSRKVGSAGVALKGYILRFGAVLGIALTGALLDLITALCFAGMFSF